MQVIDYQNRSQNRQTFDEQDMFSNRNSSNDLQQNAYFQRKIIEYDHKTKVHPWHWFVPVIQIEYNHTKTGLSLHEHPPIQTIAKSYGDQQGFKKDVKDEIRQLRQPRWAHGSQGQHQYENRQNQTRYENRQNNPPANAQQTEPYHRRNAQEKSWIRNNREWNNPQNNYNYDR